MPLNPESHIPSEEKLNSASFDEFSYKKLTTLKHFETTWNKKGTKDILGEYIRMQVIYKNYRDTERKSLETSDPNQYINVFKSYLEFAADRRVILQTILQKKGIKFTEKGELDYENLNPENKKFVQEQIVNNKTEPESIMKENLLKVADKKYYQSQYTYELLPHINQLKSFKTVIGKLEKHYGIKFFIFPGTINNWSTEPKLYVFDIDFCTAKKTSRFETDTHPEYRNFYYPFWITTVINGNKIITSIRTSRGEKDENEIKETFDVSRFKNYQEVFEYIFKKILDQGIIDKLPVRK